MKNLRVKQVDYNNPSTLKALFIHFYCSFSLVDPILDELA